MAQITDSDGTPIKAGDFIQSSYGIPPARIRGELFRKNGRLWVRSPGHCPEECSLRRFKEYLGEFWKVT